MCKDPYRNVTSIGVDVHYKFSKVAFAAGPKKILRRERLDHPDREALRARLAQWPKDVPIFMEASFGWGWLSDLAGEVQLELGREAMGETMNRFSEHAVLRRRGRLGQVPKG